MTDQSPTAPRRRLPPRARHVAIVLIAAVVTIGTGIASVLTLRGPTVGGLPASLSRGLGSPSLRETAFDTLMINGVHRERWFGHVDRITVFPIPGVVAGSMETNDAVPPWIGPRLDRVAREQPSFITDGGGSLQLHVIGGGWPAPWLFTAAPSLTQGADPTAFRAIGNAIGGATVVDSGPDRVLAWLSPGGAAISFAFWLLATWLIWTDVAARLELRARRRGRCGACGHQHPPEVGRCTECGSV